MTDWRDAMAAEFGAKEAERLIAISEAFGLDFELDFCGLDFWRGRRCIGMQ